MTVRLEPEDWPSAVASVDGPQLVVAGPGTGKTEFLVRRIVALHEAGVAAENTLVLSFSRRGAASLSDRIAAALPHVTAPVQASTFHSLALRILERFGPSTFGWESPPTLLTGPEHVQVVSELLRREDPLDWPVLFRGLLATGSFATDVADFQLRVAERSIDADELAAMAAERRDWSALPGFLHRYRDEIEARHRIDYGSLVAYAIDIARRPESGAAIRDQFRYVIVDEYQDTSPAQSALLDAITTDARNITVAADPYQSIYSFRGTDLRNVERFNDRFGAADRPARRWILARSFRVPRQIMDGALRIIGDEPLPGAAGAVAPAPHPGAVEARVFEQEAAEAEWIGDEIERLHLVEGLAYRDIAVLVRSTRNLLPELSRALHRRRIPHDLPDSRLVDHPACRLVFDIARAAVAIADPQPRSHAQADLLVRRILLGPVLGLTLGQERELARRHASTELPWPDVIATMPGGASLAGLLADPSWATEATAEDGFWKVWDGLPQLEPFVTDPARRDYRVAWSAFAQTLERQTERDPTVSLVDYHELTQRDDFEAQPLLRHRTRTEDRLTLTTLHQAKGLEYEVVIIADATDDVFPDMRRGVSLLHPEALDPEVGSDQASYRRFRLQEEMRLAYTAMTRARRRVVWTATDATSDQGEHRPSRFLTAAVGVASTDELRNDDHEPSEIISRRQALTLLRRTVVDPAAPAAARLAALHVLATPGHDWDASRFAGVRGHGPDTGVIAGDIGLSPSQAGAYSTCPRRYAFERRLRIAESGSAYATFGTLMHAVLERTDRLHHGDERPTLADALSALDDVWKIADFGTPQLTAVWKRHAVEALENMWEKWPIDSGPAILVEHPLETEIAGVTWYGRADRIERTVDGGLRIVDYKTSKNAVKVADAAASIQLGFYLHAARLDPEVVEHGVPEAAVFWFPRDGMKQRSFETTRLDEVTEQFESITRDILAERWEPKVGEHCGRCPVQSSCPAWVSEGTVP